MDRADSTDEGDRYLMYWRDQFVGTLTEVGFEDFPGAGGRIEIAELSPEVRAALEYVDREVNHGDGVYDWPFAEELLDHWRLVAPGGKEIEIGLVVIDFAARRASWR